MITLFTYNKDSYIASHTVAIRQPQTTYYDAPIFTQYATHATLKFDLIFP